MPSVKIRVCWASSLVAGQLAGLGDVVASWAGLVAAGQEVLKLVAKAVSGPWTGLQGLFQHLSAAGCQTETAAADSSA